MTLSCVVAGASGAVGQWIAKTLVASVAVSKVVLISRPRPSTEEKSPLAIYETNPKVQISYVEESDWSAGAVASGDGKLRTLLRGANLVFTAMGTSRANQEVKDAQAASTYAQGFEAWLKKVDLGQNGALAQAAGLEKCGSFVRISAIGANSSMHGTGNFFQHSACKSVI